MTNKEIINLATKLGLEEVELYVLAKESKNINVSNSKLEMYMRKKHFSLSLRGASNNQMSSVTIESNDEKSVTEAINRILANNLLLNSTEKDEIFDGKCEYVAVSNPESDASNFSELEKINLLKSIEDKILKNPQIKQVGDVTFAEVSQKVDILNSKGVDLSKSNSYLYVVCDAIGEADGETSVGYARQIKTNFKDIDPEKIANDVINKCVSGLHAASVVSNEYPIVLDKEVMSDILEAFAQIFSGYAGMKKMSMLDGKKGTQVFGKNITIVDDPFSDIALFKECFDDEGVPCKKKNIIDEGIFTGFLHSQKTAKYYNEPLTGNGFKMSGNIIPQPTNMYLLPGKDSFDSLLQGIEEGIYVTMVSGLHAGLNPVSGDFHLQSSGRMIRNGKLAEAVTLFVIAGNFFEMMNNVEKIANDLENGFTGIACPSVKINKLMVSGK